MLSSKHFLLAATVAAVAPVGGAAQDLHVTLPVDSMDFLLRTASFDIADLQGTRFQGDRTDRGMLLFRDSSAVMAQLAPAPRGGEEFNNVPRYELAAYDLQRLYMPEAEIVVPPTAIRAFDLEWYRALDPDVRATFGGINSVVVLIQSWVNFTTDENVWDQNRFDSDPLYAHHWANLNLFTYLIRHSDSNTGNVRLSTFANNPRLFAVDNGVAFRSIDSNRGTRWRSLLVDRFPATTVAALRTLTEEDLHRALGVMVQWEVRDDRLVAVPPTENIDARRGVRQRGGVVQMGLTRDEIDDVWYRLETFLRGIESGLYHVF